MILVGVLVFCVMAVGVTINRAQEELRPKGYSTEMFSGFSFIPMSLPGMAGTVDDDAEIISTNNSSKTGVCAHTDIAACLMVKEDNLIIPEWIAYHYHVLPMRDLIICEQPDSREFVEDTLQGTRWSPYSEDPLLSITYVLAGDTFFNDSNAKKFLESSKFKDAGGHRKVQKACYVYCMKEFKKRGKVSTSLIQDGVASVRSQEDQDSGKARHPLQLLTYPFPYLTLPLSLYLTNARSLVSELDHVFGYGRIPYG